jgi:ketosteroid isomerase-like protein
MKKYLTLLLALALMAGSSCKTDSELKTIAEPDPGADKEALVKLTTTDWDANFLAGNPDASVDFYTEDAVRIQDGIVYNGREEIRAFLTSEIRPGFTVSSSENTVEDIRISHDLATVRGTFLGSWANQEYGDTLWTKAAWVGIYERQEDGAWKMVFSMGTELGE